MVLAALIGVAVGAAVLIVMGGGPAAVQRLFLSNRPPKMHFSDGAKVDTDCAMPPSASELPVTERTDLDAVPECADAKACACTKGYEQYVERLDAQKTPRVDLDAELADTSPQIYDPDVDHFANDELRAALIAAAHLDDLLEEDRVVVTTVRMGADQAACERGLTLRHPNLGEMRAVLRVPHAGKAPYPAVLLLHGHTETAEQMMDRVGDALVGAGFVVLAPQLRALCADGNENKIARALLLRGQSLVGVHAAEVVAWTRVMRHWSIVDDERIGAAGHSAGASTLNLAVRIDPSIRALVTDTTSTYRERNDGDLLSTTMSPAIHPYHRLINEFSTLPIPVLPVPYGQFDHELVVDFFHAVLHVGTTTVPISDG